LHSKNCFQKCNAVKILLKIPKQNKINQYWLISIFQYSSLEKLKVCKNNKKCYSSQEKLENALKVTLNIEHIIISKAMFRFSKLE
jgi:hypothetical protein